MFDPDNWEIGGRGVRCDGIIGTFDDFAEYAGCC